MAILLFGFCLPAGVVPVVFDKVSGNGFDFF